MGARPRRYLGWSLGRRLGVALARSALRMAIRKGRPALHHLDQTFKMLRANAWACSKPAAYISMSRKENAHNDAKAEGVRKTLEYEQIHLSEYKNLAARARRSTTRTAAFELGLPAARRVRNTAREHLSRKSGQEPDNHNLTARITQRT